MYTGFKANSSVNKTVMSRQSETQLQTLQRQVDNYTRKLEQEKKKYFSIQDQYKTVSTEYEKQKQKLNELKKEASKASNVKMQAKVKNLQANLDKAIGTYDDTIAHNNKLKAEIDMLRREKKSFLESHRLLEEKIKKYEDESTQKLGLIEKKKRKCEQLKNEMLQIKQKNQEQREQYIKQFDNLQKEYMHDKRERQSFKFQKNYKPQSIDTQPLLKFRLKKIIKTNKDKMKMIEQYKKHMKSIEQAFDEIKIKSGIEDLDEITNTFIQSEEQNYSLYNYMDSLSQTIDNLEEKNIDLQSKIKLQQRKDIERKKDMEDTPEEQRKKNQLQVYIKKKQEANSQLANLLNEIRPSLSSTLKELAKSCLNDNPQKVIDYELQMNINERTVEQYLADLEKYINNLLIIKQEAKTKIVSNMKEGVTTYTKPIPGINNDDVGKQKQNEIREEGKFLQENKFREYAMEFWEKKRNKAKQ